MWTPITCFWLANIFLNAAGDFQIVIFNRKQTAELSYVIQGRMPGRRGVSGSSAFPCERIPLRPPPPPPPPSLTHGIVSSVTTTSTSATSTTSSFAVVYSSVMKRASASRLRILLACKAHPVREGVSFRRVFLKHATSELTTCTWCNGGGKVIINLFY